MKKLFFAALAVAALASCTQSETIEENASAKKAMTFDNAYIGKITRGVPVTGTAFAEGATMGVFCTESSNAVMTNQKVEFNAGAWIYTPQQFYENGKTYNFDAYAPWQDNNSFVTIDDLYTDYTVGADITKQIDLMYTDGSKIERTWTGGDAPAKIQFTFKHALAQVKFSARTIADYSGKYDLKITKLELSGVKDKATLTRNTGVWTPPTENLTACTITTDQVLNQNMNLITTANQDVFMFIPQTLDGDLTVKITVNVKHDPNHTDATVTDGDYEISATIPAGTTPDTQQKWERNRIYNYQLNLDLDNILNLKSILFAAPTIEEWSPEENINQTVEVPVPTTPAP